MIKIKCDNCQKYYQTTPSRIKFYKKHFCSVKCQKFYRKHKTPDVICHNCNKKFHLIPFHIRNNKHHFCSYKCKFEFQKHDPFWSEKMKGNKNPMWKGEKASENAGRARARTLYPEKTPCIKCGAKNSHRHHIDGNPLNNQPSNILRLCNLCHIKHDNRIQHLKSWHENPENQKKFKRMMQLKNRKFNKSMKRYFEKHRKKDGTFGNWKKL